MPDISKTDLQKAIAYLDDAADLYDALPMQKMKCRAHMIQQLTVKLKARLLTSINATSNNNLLKINRK